MENEKFTSGSSILKNLPLTTQRFLAWIAEHAERQNLSVYIVGGFVRDLILQRSNSDFDIVVEGDAIAFTKSLSRILGGRVVVHSTFGTAVWNIHSILGRLLEELGTENEQDSQELPEHVDFITAREENYSHPTVLPTVTPGKIESDLGRRDFTINTLAICLDTPHFGELLDPYHGFADLKLGLIRVLHDQSFVDDPTRQLRAVRFEQRFGFQIEPHTLQLMQKAKGFLGTITGVRLRHEMDLILKEERFQRTLTRLTELGILPAIHSSLAWDERLSVPFQKVRALQWNHEWGTRPSFGRMDFRTGMAYIVWLSGYPISTRRSIVQRLSIPQVILKTAEKTSHLRQLLPGLHGLSMSQITFKLDEFQPVVILASLCSESDHWVRHTLEQYLDQWRKFFPFSTGHDLRKIGIPSGPAYKMILRVLRAAWLDGQIHSQAEEQILLKKLLSEQGNQIRDY